MFLTVMLRCGRKRDAKSSQKFEKVKFFVFPGAENAYFRPKPQTTRKLDDLTVGLTPIDPRGSHAAKDSGLSSI